MCGEGGEEGEKRVLERGDGEREEGTGERNGK